MGLPERTRGVDELLEEARSGLDRLDPREAARAAERGAVLVDMRPAQQRDRDGSIPGAHVVSRNVLEWRLDPDSDHCDPELARTDCLVILLCDEGYQSSLAAATVRSFGVDATDVIGGVQEWMRCGLPMDRPR